MRRFIPWLMDLLAGTACEHPRKDYWLDKGQIQSQCRTCNQRFDPVTQDLNRNPV